MQLLSMLGLAYSVYPSLRNHVKTFNLQRMGGFDVYSVFTIVVLMKWSPAKTTTVSSTCISESLYIRQSSMQPATILTQVELVFTGVQ